MHDTEHRSVPCPPEETLSGLVDGDLGPQQAALVEEHLVGCLACRRIHDELQAIRSGLAALRDREPPPELFARAWGARQRRHGRWYFAAAACGAMAAALTLWASLSPGARVPAAPYTEPLGGGTPGIQASVEGELRKAERHYQNAIRMLKTLAAQEKPRWSRNRQSAFEADVQVLDQAIRMRRSLAHSVPDDPAVQDLLFTSYRAQIHYLRDVLSARSSDDAI